MIPDPTPEEIQRFVTDLVARRTPYHLHALVSDLATLHHRRFYTIKVWEAVDRLIINGDLVAISFYEPGAPLRERYLLFPRGTYVRKGVPHVLKDYHKQKLQAKCCGCICGHCEHQRPGDGQHTPECKTFVLPTMPPEYQDPESTEQIESKSSVI